MAVVFQLKCCECICPLEESSALNSLLAFNFVMASVISFISNGLTSNAASPATSGMAETLDVITGQAHFIA